MRNPGSRHAPGPSEVSALLLSVTLARTILRHVDPAVDLLVVLAAGLLVDGVPRLLEPLVDLLVVVVGEVLRLVHEAAHCRPPVRVVPRSYPHSLPATRTS